jgi:hypothetical protein
MQLHGKVDTILSGTGQSALVPGSSGMSPQMLQMQQQMQWLQQQLGGKGSFASVGSANNPLRPKAEEVMSIMSSMIEEYEKKAGAGSDGAKEQLAKLQERLETLQVCARVCVDLYVRFYIYFIYMILCNSYIDVCMF